MSDVNDGGASAKKSQTVDEVLDIALNRKKNKSKATEEKAEVSSRSSKKKFAAIKENSVYKIIFGEGEPEAKKEMVTQLLSYDLEDEMSDNKERLAEYNLFKEWMMEQRKDMAQEIINLTDTDAFSELKDVFDEMNQGMLDFENLMSPLTEILDAVYELRMADGGTMFDVFKEIKEDQAFEEKKAKQEAELESYNLEVERIKRQNKLLVEDKSFFGLWKTKKSALKSISDNDERRAQILVDVAKLTVEIEENGVDRVTKFGDFKDQKGKLRELLDITSEEHKDRQQALVDSANNFVDTADTRTTSVLSHLEGINKQVDRLSDSNRGMRSVYAIISEAAEEADESNKTVLSTLTEPSADESNIDQMKRENKKMFVEEHVTALIDVKVDTVGTFADLTAESYRIKAMKDANNSQVAKTRSLNSKGVSGVASRLSTVLQGVSMAALTESSEVAQMTLERMNSQTNAVTQKEAIKNAVGISAENDALVRVIEELQSYGKVAKVATEISREGLQDMRVNLDELERTTQSFSDDIKKSIGVSADVMHSRDGGGTDSTDSDAADNDGGSDGSPFDKVS